MPRDIAAGDFVSLIWANSRILDANLPVVDPNTWRRHVHLMLSGFRAGNNDPLPEDELSDQKLYDSMDHLGTQALLRDKLGAVHTDCFP